MCCYSNYSLTLIRLSISRCSAFAPAQRSLARSWRAPSCLPHHRKSHIVRTIFNQRIISSHIHSNSTKSAVFSTVFFSNLKSTMTTPPVEHAPVIISEPNLPSTEQKFLHAANSPISRMPTVSPSPTAVQLTNQSASSASVTPSAVSESQDGMIAKLLEHLQQQQQNQQVQQQGETSSLKFQSSLNLFSLKS